MKPFLSAVRDAIAAGAEGDTALAEMLHHLPKERQKRTRFEGLREREEAGTLTETEKVELAEMIEEIERAEEAYLRPATERAGGTRRVVGPEPRPAAPRAAQEGIGPAAPEDPHGSRS